MIVKIELRRLSATMRKMLASEVDDYRVLAKMAKDLEFNIRATVAENPHTSLSSLTKLAKDREATVRCAVARNPNVPSYILAKLAKDPSAGVRRFVSKHPNTSYEILLKLCKDKDGAVREASENRLYMHSQFKEHVLEKV